MSDTPPSLDVLYLDQRLVVVNKPAGLPCHPGRAGGASVEAGFAAWRRGRDGPWLAHRLDQDTAGCLVIARRKSVLLALQRAFAAGDVEKTYWAIVRGRPAAATGVVDVPLAKVLVGRRWHMAAGRDGQAAVTDYAILAEARGLSLLALRPRTGRTHQVRAHCAWLGCPVLGDAVYGAAGPGLCLLARGLNLALEPPVRVTAPLPPHMRGLGFDAVAA